MSDPTIRVCAQRGCTFNADTTPELCPVCGNPYIEHPELVEAKQQAAEAVERQRQADERAAAEASKSADTEAVPAASKDTPAALST